MFNQISWTNYFETIAILTVIYYGIVLPIYYKSAFANILSRTNRQIPVTAFSGESFEVQHLADEVRALIHQAGYDRSCKEEILFALQKLISSERFQSISQLPFAKNINDLITEECQTNCSIPLSEEDLHRLWVSR